MKIAGWPGAQAQSHQWCLRRSPHLWKDPDTFRPERFSETNSNAAFEGRWAGYRPEAQGSSLYPNEVAADFAFIPFGGGARKCVGDQFALLEATVALSMLLRQVPCDLVSFLKAAPPDLWYVKCGCTE